MRILITNDDGINAPGLEILDAIAREIAGPSGEVWTVAPAGHLAVKDLDKSIAINLRATADLIGVLSPLLGPTGRAVFFDDPRGGEKFFGHYGSTKAAQIALAQSWQAEGERIGPHVTILQPQPMSTATRARFYPGEDRAALAHPSQEAQRLLPMILG